ncbi:MAG: response regulator transcription factor [Lachnospiraceae bacterium]|nr:response regulator transcription factor [Lachnospiraceae bacterium]
MNIAVTDDNPKDREKIIRILSEYAASNNMDISVSEYDNAGEFLADYRPLLYSAVFLDIYMDGTSGIEAAQQIRETDRDAIIVFLTTSEDHMPDAFRLHAYEYIVKPVRKEDLFPVMDDILKKSTPVSSPSFSFPVRDGQAVVLFDDLVTVGTDAHNYLVISDKDGNEHLTRMTFANACDHLLHDKRFLQARRGVIVNMAYIKSFDDALLHLTVGKPVPIGPRNRKKLEQIWDNYLMDRMRSGILTGGNRT